MMNKKNLKSLKNDKRAVSPVIGVILMVAITVILAAVIGAFVFGMGGGVKAALDLRFTSVEAHVDTAAGYLTMTAVGVDRLTIPSGAPTSAELIAVVEVNGGSVTVSSMTTVPIDTSLDAGTRLKVITASAFAAGDSIHVILTDPGTGTILLDTTVSART